MTHLSYFVALAAMGSFVLLMALGSFATIGVELVGMALGARPNEETAKAIVYSTVAFLWTCALVAIWVRNQGLSPRRVVPGRGAWLTWGHGCLAVGHLLVLSLFIFQELGLLMILPVLVVLILYSVGIALVEAARDRRPIS
ncbi:MAG: hypothetical protein WAO95_17360 [Burkholderiales bacterium]